MLGPDRAERIIANADSNGLTGFALLRTRLGDSPPGPPRARLRRTATTRRHQPPTANAHRHRASDRASTKHGESENRRAAATGPDDDFWGPHLCGQRKARARRRSKNQDSARHSSSITGPRKTSCALPTARPAAPRKRPAHAGLRRAQSEQPPWWRSTRESLPGNRAPNRRHREALSMASFPLARC